MYLDGKPFVQKKSQTASSCFLELWLYEYFSSQTESIPDQIVFLTMWITFIMESHQCKKVSTSLLYCRPWSIIFFQAPKLVPELIIVSNLWIKIDLIYFTVKKGILTLHDVNDLFQVMLLKFSPEPSFFCGLFCYS